MINFTDQRGELVRGHPPRPAGLASSSCNAAGRGSCAKYYDLLAMRRVRMNSDAEARSSVSASCSTKASAPASPGSASPARPCPEASTRRRSRCARWPRCRAGRGCRHSPFTPSRGTTAAFEPGQDRRRAADRRGIRRHAPAARAAFHRQRRLCARPPLERVLPPDGRRAVGPVQHVCVSRPVRRTRRSTVATCCWSRNGATTRSATRATGGSSNIC